MSTRDIVDFIEVKRKSCSEDLQDWLDKGEITRESFQELAVCNEQLSQILKASVIKGDILVQKKVFSSWSELLAFEKKPRNADEAFEVMRKLVVEGSENPYVRDFAVRMAEGVSKRGGIPAMGPPTDELYSGVLEEKDIEWKTAVVSLSERVAQDIYKFVRRKWVYVSDPPDDYYQPAYHTLEILDLKGDCDDLAIILCSLLRSIGYRTFLGFQQQHVFAGVVLARLCSPSTQQGVTESEKTRLQYVKVPLDSQFEGFEMRFGDEKTVFSGFDVLNGDFGRNSQRLIRQRGGLSSDDAKKIEEDFPGICARLSKIFGDTTVFFVDQGMPTVRVMDVFMDEFSKLFAK